MNIQWYPGHMTKAKRMLEENLKVIDVVIELVDARAPAATRNPDFEYLFSGKSRVVLLNKCDLADKNATDEWIKYLNNSGVRAEKLIAQNRNSKKAVTALIEAAAKEKIEQYRKKGVAKTVRAIVAGIPNVGKSTLINTIAGASRAAVGDRPGVTQGKQWVKITPYLELMDTPGLLWPKFDNATAAKHIAFIGSVRDDILDVEELASELVLDLLKRVPDKVIERYSKVTPDATMDNALEQVCRSRGFILPGNNVDTERAARVVLDEFRAGKICKVTLDEPGVVYDTETR